MNPREMGIFEIQSSFSPFGGCHIINILSLKEKAWHLTWMPLAFLASLQPQRQPTRFTGGIWVILFCQALGAPIPLLRAHAVARTQCACQRFVLDQYGDHMLKLARKMAEMDFSDG